MNNLSEDINYYETKNKLLSDLLSHRLRHQDRQLTSLQITNNGVKSVHGPSSRKVLV